MAYNAIGVEGIIDVLFKDDDDIFEEVKSYLRQQGIGVSAIHLIVRSCSCYYIKDEDDILRLPHLDIVTSDTESYNKIIDEPIKLGRLNEQVRLNVLALWEKLCIKYQVDMKEHYHPKMYIGACNAEQIVFSYIASKYKYEINKIVYKVLRHYPRFVRSGQTPVIYLIFSRAEFAQYNIDAQKERITKEIQLFSQKKAKELTGHNMNTIITVQFWHPLMRGYHRIPQSESDDTMYS